MKHLLRAWPNVALRVRQQRRMVVFMDYDGTLTPIAPTPKRARLPRRARALLKQLSRLPNMLVGVVSGRSLGDVRRLIDLKNIIYVGNHGLELRGPRMTFIHPQARGYRAGLRRLARRLCGAFRKIPGAWMEWKGLTMSLHWRAVPRSAHRRFHRVVERLTASARQQGLIRLTQGKRVVEIRPPVEWDKGRMIDWLVRRLSVRRESGTPYVLYVGDDQTDEAAFRITNRLRGLSVFVGHRGHPTAARYWLKNPREVHRWLAALLQLRREAAASRRDGTWTGTN